MIRFLRFLFFLIFVKPLVLVILGMNVRNLERLPQKGPAILVANHNSHLDTLVLMSLFPLKILDKVRPVADSTYFLRTKFSSWFFLNIFKIIPIKKGEKTPQVGILKKPNRALQKGDILILFPEGTRGEPERLSRFKLGIAALAEQNQDIPIIPVFMHGLGQALPRGDWLLVPFFCDILIGEKIEWSGDKKSFMSQLDLGMKTLALKGRFPAWE